MRAALRRPCTFGRLRGSAHSREVAPQALPRARTPRTPRWERPTLAMKSLGTPGKKNRKECHAPMRRAEIYGQCTPPSSNGFKKESESAGTDAGCTISLTGPTTASKKSRRVPDLAARACLSRGNDHRCGQRPGRGLISCCRKASRPARSWPARAARWRGFARGTKPVARRRLGPRLSPPGLAP